MVVEAGRRRVAVALALLLAPLVVSAQGSTKVYRIGYLTALANFPIEAEFRDAMRDLGYVEGKNLIYEMRSAEGRPERMPDAAADLVRSKVDLIIAVAPASIRAAKQATSTIPIVMKHWGGPDLVESGIVASLARSGNNITGIHMFSTAVDPKRLDLLLQAVPKAKVIAVLTHGGEAVFGPQLPAIREFARSAGLQLHMADVAPVEGGYEQAFEAMVRARADALLVPVAPQFARDSKLIVEQAARRRMPMMSSPQAARQGALMGYAANGAQMQRRAAAIVDRLLKGAKPGDVPIEQPTTFEFVINLNTAKALGQSIPQALLLRADEVIQ